MKLVFFIITVLLVIILAGFLGTNSNKTSNNNQENTQLEDEKVYVALEEEGKVAVIDSASKKVVRTIDLSKQADDGETIRFMAHNVQVAPSGTSVAVTANVSKDMQDHNMTQMSEMSQNSLFDELIIIDPLTDMVLKRIPIDTDSHLAHVVITKDGKTAYVTSQEKDLIYSVDIEKSTVINKIQLGQKTQPHGLRLSTDDSKVFVALMGKGLTVVDINTGKSNVIDIDGAGVQTAVTPDGQFAFVSLYDKKEIGWLNTNTSEKGSIKLPGDALGPVQLYPSPDSKYLYVADQGYYFNQPTGNYVFVIDVKEKKVNQKIKAGEAPHGIVLNKSGDSIFVTNLLSGDVSVIDPNTSQEIAKIQVGKMPNGISVWNINLGGTP